MKWLLYPVLWLRGVIGIVIIVVMTAISGTAAIFVAVVLKQKWLENLIIQFWSWVIIKWFCIRCHVINREYLNRGGILLFTHKSNMDIPVMFYTLSSTIRFGAKLELFSIPIFGPALKAVGMLPIARQNREEVLNVYNEAIKRVNAGEQFALAPEGTRIPGENLGEFKAGPFIFAINGQLPLFPIILVGADHVVPKGRFLAGMGSWRSDVYVQVLEPIETKGLTLEDRKELQQKTHEKMVAAHQALRREVHRQ